MQVPTVAETKKEMSFSLAELQAEASLDVAVEAPSEEVPPAFTGDEAALPVESAAPVVTADFEQGLRESARSISAEFEDNYRRSLGELLARLRADLEGQATDDWNRTLRQAEDRLQEVAVQQRSLLQQELALQDESQALLNAKLEELRNARDYVESLLRMAPQTLQHHFQQGTTAALAEMRTQLTQEFAALAETQGNQLEQHLQAALAQAAQEARQNLLDDFDRHEREFLDRIAVRLEEVRASADHTREFTKRASTDIARQSEQLRVDLQTQYDSLFEQQRQELATRLEERHRQLSQAAHTAFQDLGGRLWGSLRQQLNTDFETRSRALQQALQKAQAETRHLEERTEKLAAQLDADLEARLDHAVQDTARRAQSQLQPLLDAAQEEAHRRLQAEREEFHAQDEREQQALTESLCAQRAQLLAEFKRDSESIAADCLARYQTAMRETLESIEEVLRSKLKLPREASQP
jgi:hypothetical protein